MIPDVDTAAERIGSVAKTIRTVILMPRWGVKTILTKEATISLPRVTILESKGGFADDLGPCPLDKRAAG